MLLLRLLRWIRSNVSLEFEVLCREGGPLVSDFAALCRVEVAESRSQAGRVRRVARRAVRELGLDRLNDQAQARRLVQQFERRKFDIVYSNTITNGRLVSQLDALGCKVITHVHELQSWIRRAGKENLRLVKEQTSQYIACAAAVKENLIQHCEVDAARIDVVHGFVVTDEINSSQASAARLRTRLELGIPEEAFVIGASGTLDWRKGPDLFIQLAYRVHKMCCNSPIYFVWLGGSDAEDNARWELTQDVRAAGLSKYVTFVAARPSALEYFCAFDVFALVSREDPFPLVCLEAASIGKPILCFDAAGGEREFVENDCGFVVPYLDVELMALRTVELFRSRDLLERMGCRASRKVKERHDVSVAAPRIVEIIERARASSMAKHGPTTE